MKNISKKCLTATKIHYVKHYSSLSMSLKSIGQFQTGNSEDLAKYGETAEFYFGSLASDFETLKYLRTTTYLCFFSTFQGWSFFLGVPNISIHSTNDLL